LLAGLPTIYPIFDSFLIFSRNHTGPKEERKADSRGFIVNCYRHKKIYRASLCYRLIFKTIQFKFWGKLGKSFVFKNQIILKDKRRKSFSE
jgi:hypothetical protein